MSWLFPGNVKPGGVNATSGVDDVVGVHVVHVEVVLYGSLSLLLTDATRLTDKKLLLLRKSSISWHQDSSKSRDRYICMIATTPSLFNTNTCV